MPPSDYHERLTSGSRTACRRHMTHLRLFINISCKNCKVWDEDTQLEVVEVGAEFKPAPGLGIACGKGGDRLGGELDLAPSTNGRRYGVVW
jgi:hypothetical protein